MFLSVSYENNDSMSGNNYMCSIPKGVKAIYSNPGVGVYTKNTYFTWSNNKISWYGSDSGSQYNDKSKLYYWVVLSK